MVLCPKKLDFVAAILATIQWICNRRVMSEFLFPDHYLFENFVSTFNINVSSSYRSTENP